MTHTVPPIPMSEAAPPSEALLGTASRVVSGCAVVRDRMCMLLGTAKHHTPGFAMQPQAHAESYCTTCPPEYCVCFLLRLCRRL